MPLHVHFVGVDAAPDSRSRKCPWCNYYFVLWTYPGGFMSCAQSECKAQALDACMESADQEDNVPLNRHTGG